MVIVDDRGGHGADGAGSLELAKRRLRALHNRGVDADLARLEFGDYAIVGNGPGDTTIMVGVELKTSRDLLNSLRSNRLTGFQVPGMVKLYEGRVWLVTEGIWREASNGDWEVHQGTWQTYSAGSKRVQLKDLEAWVLSTCIGGGVQHWHCQTQADTARFIDRLDHYWCDKAYEEHRTFDVVYRRPPDRITFTEPSDFVKMIMAPSNGIGTDKARAIEEYFLRDWDRLHAADLRDLQDIPGIGKVLATRLYKTLHPTRTLA